MKTKMCSRCGIYKPLGQFHKRAASRDGLQPRCKACNAECAGVWQARNPERRAAIRREWTVKNPEKVRKSARCDYANHTKARLLKVKKYRAKYPEKIRAQRALQAAVKAGKIQKPWHCLTCGRVVTKVHGHHDDYSKPLEVKWVCARCHAAIHREVYV